MMRVHGDLSLIYTQLRPVVSPTGFIFILNFYLRRRIFICSLSIQVNGMKPTSIRTSCDIHPFKIEI